MIIIDIPQIETGPSEPEGGGTGPPVFGKSVTSISNKRADYAHHLTTYTQIFKPSYGPAQIETTL